MSEVPTVYDFVGQPIRAGNLVAYSGNLTARIMKQRVSAVSIMGSVLLQDGSVRLGADCVVLEEPIWPNV